MTPISDDQGARPPNDVAALIAPISDVLLASLSTLADAGETDAACRLAGRAYAHLRKPRPAIARRFDVLLHRLTPKLTWKEPPRPTDVEIGRASCRESGCRDG